jgi:hypothetical protein
MTMRKILLVLSCLGAVLCSAGVRAQGLTPSPNALGGPFWQARFERDPYSLLSARGVASTLLPGGPLQSLSLRLLSDYQLSTLRLGDTGGLRLTGGLLINMRQSQPGLLSNDVNAALPYAGIGYASSGLKGAWGFSADVGLAAQGLSSLRLDRLVNGNGNLSTDGSLRLLPMIRLGMNLAF